MKTIQIYTLTDPRNNQVFYVGATSQELHKRLAHHRHNNPIAIELKWKGKNAIIDTIEETDEYNAGWLETYWIRQFTAWGFKLNNVRRSSGYRVPRPKHAEVMARRLQYYNQIFSQVNPTDEQIKKAAKYARVSEACVRRYMSGQAKVFNIIYRLERHFKLYPRQIAKRNHLNPKAA